MSRADIKTICRLSDAGTPVAAIAEVVGLTQGRVYALLREYRPNRPRALRGRTSDKPRAIEGLNRLGFKPARIASLLGVKRQYVYRVLGEGRI